MKKLRWVFVFLVLLGLFLIIINIRIFRGKWYFVNTSFGPLHINSSSQTSLFFNELGKTDVVLIFIRNKEINPISDYHVWNPPRNFDNKIVLGCKINEMFQGFNVIYFDIDVDKLKSDDYRKKANELLPNLVTACLTRTLINNSVILEDDKIKKLIDVSQGMVTLR